MKVMIADKFETAGIDGLKSIGCDVLYEPAPADLAGAVASSGAAALIVRSTKVPAPVLERAQSLRLIVRAGSGVDNIDVNAATARKIAVCNCPGMNAVAVAELTMALLLCCDRRVADQTAALRAGAWNKKGFAKGRGLKGLTLGVIGVGAIGQEVIRRAVAFEMNVVAWSRSITPQHASALRCEFGGTDTPALLAVARRCDAVTVHLPLTDTTRKIFGRAFFEAMKPGAYFINTSRGGVVDEAALRDAMRSKGIRAGLDVYEGQPAEGEAAWACETAAIPGFVGTHHVGASTDQAQLAVAEETVRVVRLFKDEGRAVNCVNGASLGFGG